MTDETTNQDLLQITDSKDTTTTTEDTKEIEEGSSMTEDTEEALIKIGINRMTEEEATSTEDMVIETEEIEQIDILQSMN